MSDYEYDIPMPKSHKDCLLKLVELSKENNVLSVFYLDNRSKTMYEYDFQFTVGKSEITSVLPEDPFPGFEILGLARYTKENLVFLTPEAYKWASYQKKSRFRKWLARLPENIKDVMLVMSFVFSLIGVILSGYLAYLQILEKIK